MFKGPIANSFSVYKLYVSLYPAVDTLERSGPVFRKIFSNRFLKIYGETKFLSPACLCSNNHHLPLSANADGWPRKRERTRKGTKGYTLRERVRKEVDGERGVSPRE